jgi:creatinine amidohydrolase
MSTQERLLLNLNWTEVQNVLKKTSLAIIPMGSTEQHGEHLPLGTDLFRAIELSLGIAGKTGGIVLPVLYGGYSPHHL